MGDKEKKKQIGIKLNEIELLAVEIYLGNRREEQVTFDSLIEKTVEKMKPTDMKDHIRTIRKYLDMMVPDIAVHKTITIDGKEVDTLWLQDKYVQGTVDLHFASITDMNVHTHTVHECECGGHLDFINRIRPEGIVNMYDCEPSRSTSYWVCDKCGTIFSRFQETPYGSYDTNYEDFKVYVGYTIDQLKRERECDEHSVSLLFTR